MTPSISRFVDVLAVEDDDGRFGLSDVTLSGIACAIDQSSSQ